MAQVAVLHLRARSAGFPGAVCRNRVLDMEDSGSSLIDALPGQRLEQLLGIWRMPRVGLQAAQLQASLLSLLISLRRLGGPKRARVIAGDG